MSKKKVLILVVIVAILFCIVSCKNSITEEVENNVIDEDENKITDEDENEITDEDESNMTYKVETLGSSLRYSRDPENWSTKQLIKTKESLEQFYLKYNIAVDVSNYNDDYFNEKAIIICLFTYPYLGAKLNIKSLQIIDDTIQIKIKEKKIQKGGYAAAIDYWICALEVNQNDVINIDNIEVLFE